MNSVSSIKAGKAEARTPAQAPGQREFPWKRFIIQSLIAMVVFNIVAGLVTWYIIFPHMFPAAR